MLKITKGWARAFFFAIGIIILIVFLAFTSQIISWHTGKVGVGDKPFDLYVNPGQNFSSVVNELEPRLRSPFWFTIYGWWHNYDKKILAGNYRLNPEDSVEQWYKQLIEGNTAMYKVALIPGFNLKQLEKRLCTEAIGIKCPETIDWEKLKSKLKINSPNMEGQFLAETYVYDNNFPVEKLLSHANSELWNYLNSVWKTRNVKTKKIDSPYDVLILASIIEKETSLFEERRTIAGVFSNRLNLGMRLQSDPTVIYAMGEEYEKERRIRKRHLRMASKYNTYRVYGLPPTPIGIVSKASIDAVLDPEQTSALYFVSKGDGSHYFSSSLKEHNRAVRKYILKK